MLAGMVTPTGIGTRSNRTFGKQSSRRMPSMAFSATSLITTPLLWAMVPSFALHHHPSLFPSFLSPSRGWQPIWQWLPPHRRSVPSHSLSPLPRRRDCQSCLSTCSPPACWRHPPDRRPSSSSCYVSLCRRRSPRTSHIASPYTYCRCPSAGGSDSPYRTRRR